MQKNNNRRRGFIAGIFCGALIAGACIFFIAQAFNGPGSNSAGSGNGAIGVGANNNISIGTTTPTASTTALIVGSTTDNTAAALKVQKSDATPLFYIRNDGGFGFATTSLTAGQLTVQGNLTVSGNITCGSGCGGGISGGVNNWIPLWTGASTLATSTLQQNGTTTYTTGGFAVGTSTIQGAGNLFITGNYLGGTISAGLVSSNLFGSGNFAFPSNLGVGTTTTAVPSTLSVYGSTLLTGGAFDASGDTTFKVPVAAAPAVNASGSIAYDTNKNLLEYGDGNVTGTIPRTLYLSALPAWLNGGLAASDTISGVNQGAAEKAFQTSYTIPANFLIANKTLELKIGLQIAATTTAPTHILRLELRQAGTATTSIYTSRQAGFCSVAPGTCGLGLDFIITALTAPAANASVTVTCITCAPFGNTGLVNAQNTTAQPVAVATNAALILQISNQAASANDTSSLILYDLQEIN